MSDYLLTETSDTLITERSNYLAYDSFETCDWPTIAETKNYLGFSGSSSDVYLQKQIYAVIEEIEGYLGRSVPMQVQTDTIRAIESDKSYGYASKVQLKRYPIIEVIEIYGDDELVDVDTRIEYEGLLSGEFNAYEKVTIKYHGGLSPVPYDLEDVFYSMVKARYIARNDTDSNKDIKKRTIPNVITEEFFPPFRNDPTQVGSYSSVLDKYKALHV